jgi:RNA polymerase sigma factor (sigma-70 family)
MPSRADRLLLHVRRIASRISPDDSALLTQFLATRDPSAFEALVARHGPMVQRVCERVLGNRHDAEDACQATFLVLARKAGSVRPASALAAWLHGVACRVALGARTSARRRRLREAPAPDLAPPDLHADPLAELTAREALQILDEEVQRLPVVYRLPVILCCLEGLSQEEAARQLGCTPGSVKGRLERGRKHLHRRLARRGLEVTAVLGLVEISRAAAAGLTRVMVTSTAKAAVAFATGDPAGVCGVTAEVARLAELGLHGVALVKVKVGLAAALLVGLVAASAGVLTQQALPAKDSPPKQEAQSHRSHELELEGKQPPRTDSYGDLLPPGAVARVGSVRWWSGRHYPLVYASDGKSLVSCHAEKAVCFLDTATGKELRRIEPAGNGVTCFALAPDGKTVVTASFRGAVLRLWEVSTCKELRQISAEQLNTQAVAFSPDGKMFAAATGDTGIWFWDVTTWKVTRRLMEERAGSSDSVGFSADGKTLISGIRSVKPFDKIVWWDVGTGRQVRRLDKEVAAGFEHLTFSPDGKRLAAIVSPNVLCLWDAGSGKEISRTVTGPKVDEWRLCFSPDGQTLACSYGVGRRRNQTLFLAAATGQELRRWDEGNSWTNALAYSPDGKVLAQAMPDVIRLREVATGKPMVQIQGLPDRVMAVAFDRAGNRLIASCLGGRTAFADPLTGAQVAALQSPQSFDHWEDTLTLTADGTKAALIDAKGVLHVWETATGKLWCRIADPPVIVQHEQAIFTPDGKVVVVEHRDGVLRLWDTTVGKLVCFLSKSKEIPFPDRRAFSPDGRVLATASNSSEYRTIHLWDTATGKEIGRLAWHENARPSCLVFSPDGRYLIVASGAPERAGEFEEDSVRVWDVASRRELYRFATELYRFGTPDGGKRSAAISPDGKTLAAAAGRVVLLWELASGKERGRLAGHHATVSSLAFSPDGLLLASGALDHTALVWDLTGMCPAGKWSSHDARPGEMERLWADLGSADGIRAYRALWATAAARQAVPFLAKRLRPVAPVEEDRLTGLIADLDSGRFMVRSQASKELRRLAELAEPALRRALAGKPSLETGRRLSALLEECRTPSTEQLQVLRALEALEHIGTAGARQLLKDLAQGAPRARASREAKAALERLERREPGNARTK